MQCPYNFPKVHTFNLQFWTTFDNCLSNLACVLKWCLDTNFLLNLEKCHFMVQDGIVLGHQIYSKGVEANRTKIEVIEKLPPLINVKGIHSFLWLANFDQRFIKDFSKISKPLCDLLMKDVPFDISRA